MSSLEIDLANGGQPSSSLQSSILPATPTSTAFQLPPVPSTASCEEEPMPSTSAGCLRLLRSRTVSDSSSNLHKTNRRVIQKPKKRYLPASDEDVIKFYLNTKLNKVKPTFLETIIEGDEEDDEIDNYLYHNIGPGAVKKKAEKKIMFNKNVITRALRRSLSCTDGQNVTKATILKRKRRAKALLNGTTFRSLKISMAKFQERLSLMNTSENSETDDMQTNDEYAYHEEIHTSD